MRYGGRNGHGGKFVLWSDQKVPEDGSFSGGTTSSFCALVLTVVHRIVPAKNAIPPASDSPFLEFILSLSKTMQTHCYFTIVKCTVNAYIL
jgi:hypothetical protein